MVDAGVLAWMVFGRGVLSRAQCQHFKVRWNIAEGQAFCCGRNTDEGQR